METTRSEQVSLLKKCSRSVSSLSILLIIYFLFSRFLSKIYLYICYTVMTGKITLSLDVLKDYFSDKQEMLSSTVFQMTADIVITVCSISVMLLVARLAFKTTVWSCFKVEKKGITTGFKWLAPCFVFNMLASTVISFFTGFLNQMGVDVPTADFSIRQPSVFAVIMQFAYVIIFAPLFEEIIYRGLILKAISPYSKTAAVFVSALTFGLMHGNIPQAASAFCTGFLYAVIALRCNSIIPTVIIHGINNLIVCSPDFAEVLGIPYNGTMISAIEICLALFGFFLWFTQYKFIFCFDDTPKDEQNKAVFRAVLKNPILIVYLSLLILTVVFRLIKANS